MLRLRSELRGSPSRPKRRRTLAARPEFARIGATGHNFDAPIFVIACSKIARNLPPEILPGGPAGPRYELSLEHLAALGKPEQVQAVRHHGRQPATRREEIERCSRWQHFPRRPSKAQAGEKIAARENLTTA